MPLQSCYMCCQLKTSVEHVPPRCLFPQKKDLPEGVDLRKQLITVPSCDEHNTAKSKDDEYLLYTLLLSIPNNKTAENYFFNKAVRAMKHAPSIFQGFTKTQVPVTAIDEQSGEVHNTIAVQIDEERLHSSLASIGQALYFHHYKSPWEGSIKAYPHFLMHLKEDNARELNEPNEKMQQVTEQLMVEAELHGENPEVFSYQFAEGNESTTL
ncbi:MAG: hypothetical protein RPS47_11130, partial [Colwellia sp.]